MDEKDAQKQLVMERHRAFVAAENEKKRRATEMRVECAIEALQEEPLRSC